MPNKKYDNLLAISWIVQYVHNSSIKNQQKSMLTMTVTYKKTDGNNKSVIVKIKTL
jgi:hypothetical protein